MRRELWAGRRVLLTGHTGFKGSWLALWLQRAGAEVCGVSLAPPTSPSLFALAGVGRGMSSREGDVRDAAVLAAAMREHRPEVVMHLAAQALVRRSYDEPVETYSTNVLGTAAVLDAVRRAPTVRVVLVVTSDKCYSNDGRAAPYTESDHLGGADPYSSSKAAAELVTAAYRTSFFRSPAADRPAVATARAGNVIAGGDWATDRLVPDIMQALLCGRPPVIRSPDAVRPWQHVLDCLGGYLCLAERLIESGEQFEGAWNFGPDAGESPTVRIVADRLCDAWGGGARWVSDSSPQAPEARYLQLDCTKARERLTWRPRLALDDTLRSIVDWYRAYARGDDVRRVTLRHIEAFEERP